MHDMPAQSTLESSLQNQLLRQLGERLRLMRKAKCISAVELAQAAGISRSTLHAVESGAASPTMGTYLRVLAALGAAADLALVATAEPDRGPASPASNHIAQDYQSWLMHQEAVRRITNDPSLAGRAEATLEKWMAKGDARTMPLWTKWREILAGRRWDLALATSEEARELRQASPLSTVLPQDVRLDIIAKVRGLKELSSAEG